MKSRFYLLAKEMHPDVVRQQEGSDAEAAHDAFVKISAAFESILDDMDLQPTGRAQSTAPRAAARGGARRRPSAVRHEDGSVRARSLGEILCEQLREDPAAANDVWQECVAQQCDVRESMLDELFRACAASGSGLPGALAILRDATKRGLINTRVREAAIVSLIKWCKEDADSLPCILAEVDEAEKTPETLEMISNANFLYSGYADGYNIKR